MNEMNDNTTARKEASPESITRLRDSFNVHCSLMGQTLENSMPVYKTCLELLKDPQHADNPFLMRHSKQPGLREENERVCFLAAV